MIHALSVLMLLNFPAAAAETPAEDSPALAGASMLAEAFGAEGLENFAAKGYLVLQGGKTGTRLEFAQWKALRDIAAVGPAVLEFAAAYDRFLGDNPIAPPGAALGFTTLARLPATGLMTPSLHALIQGLAAVHEEVTALSGSGEALSYPGELLFTTKWGKSFAARTHAPLSGDLGPLLKPYFESHLGGIRPSEDAVRHFLDHLAHAYKTDAAALLEKDAKTGSPSEELRAWLRKYFTDQKRLYALKRSREMIKDIAAKKGFAQELKSLVEASKILTEKPGLLESVRQRLNAPGPAPRVLLTSAGAHLQKPTRLGRHELGDTVIISGAYWVDGLAEGEKITVDETVFADLEHSGLSDVLTKTETRVNGGPYVYTRTLTLKDSRNLTVRSIIGSKQSKSLSESLEVVVTADFDKALSRLANAENLSLECSLKDAEAAYGQLEQDYAEAAAQKRQYADLVATAAGSKRAAAKNAAAFAKLDENLSELRADSSPQQCRYDLKRVEAAIKSVRSLPAGCDSRLGEMLMERRAIARRADDQRFVAQSIAGARSQKKNCGFSAAVENYLNALSVLDADPAARCGAAEAAALAAESELFAARLGELRLAASGRELKAAMEESTPVASLKRLRSLIASNSGMHPSECFQKDILEASQSAETLGDSIPVPGESDVAMIFPADASLAAASRDVEEERRRIAAAEEASRAKELAEQAPSAPSAAAVSSDQALENLLQQESKETPPVKVTPVEPKKTAIKESASKKASKPARKAAKKKKSAAEGKL